MSRRRTNRRRAPYDRMDRVNELVRQVLAESIDALADPRLEPVTVTGVNVTNDLAYATVYYATLGVESVTADSDDIPTSAAAGLASAAGVLRRAIAREVRLRQAPELRFVVDPAIEQGARIDEILRELDLGESAASGDDVGPA